MYVLKSQLYTPILSFSAAIMCMAIGLKKRKYFTNIKNFSFYAAAYASLYLVQYILIVAVGNELVVRGIVNYYDNLFTIVEFIIYMTFFKSFFKQSSYQRAIEYLFYIYIVIFIYLTIRGSLKYGILTQSVKSTIYTIESLFLLVPCIFYFFYLFQRQPILRLLNEPTFWIIIGLFFMLFCILPYSIAENYFLKNESVLGKHLGYLFDIFYMINFLMIARAYLCKPRNIAQ